MTLFSWHHIQYNKDRTNVAFGTHKRQLITPSHLTDMMLEVYCKNGEEKCLRVHHLQSSLVASWSSGRVQDSGLGSRSSPEFNTLLVVPLSKALHTALLLSTQEQSGYLWGQICKPWRQVACERLYTPQGVEMDIQMDMECKGPMTREGTCQSLQSRALSLDVDSKQWLYFFYFLKYRLSPAQSKAAVSTLIFGPLKIPQYWARPSSECHKIISGLHIYQYILYWVSNFSLTS